MSSVCYQINLQRSLGGGEIFTRFFSRALASLGCRSVLLVARGAAYWRALQPAADIIEVADEDELKRRLPNAGALVVMHTVASEALARELAAVHRLAGIAHMPLYEREPRGLRHCRRVFCVSQHVIESARAKGMDNVDPEPVYGVADLSPRGGVCDIVQRSPYDWDRHKLRDCMLAWFEGAFPSVFASGRPFARSEAVCLGIVSRLTPIKQFPAMFAILAPIIARHAQVRIEVFGAGGYASVRDLRRALQPCAVQVGFWGHQADVAAVYRQLDYVLSGLPEKEALGLNLIEAQACGTPVLAVRAPPFTETVSEPASGFFFEDPRADGGRSFESLLERIGDRSLRPHPLEAPEHLQRFSEPAFRARVERVLTALQD